MTNSTFSSDLNTQFLAHVHSAPSHAAVIDRHGDVTTFQCLGNMVAAVQTELIDHQARALGLYSPPSASLVASAWGALCTGIPYVPLSPTYPDERLRFMVADSGVDLILAPAEQVDEIAALVVGLDVTVRATPESRGQTAPVDRAAPSSLAYILYTSGSTGTPKGVEISHSALNNQLDWVKSELDLVSGSRIIHKTPISFDAAQWEILANGTGATVIAAGAHDYRDPISLIDTIIEHDVTHLQVVPTLLQALCEEPRFGACTSIRVLACGGDALPGRLAGQTYRTLRSIQLINLYGPTETTINAASHRISNADMDSNTVAIGTPVSGLTFHLVNEHGQLTTTPIGELAIAGKQLAERYRNLPEETKKRFITRHIDGREIRLYRTGDRVELRNGVFHFRGRTDSQVKIRGHRVELDEIRSVLENHDWVRHACVFIVKKSYAADMHLAAYVELNPHEAALMDQGVHDDHHRSKTSRVQVRAQVAGLGIRDDLDSDAVALLVSGEEHHILERLAFSRKTYRTFQSSTIDLDQLADLGRLIREPREISVRYSSEWSLESAAFLLRSLVQYRSESRLLPKYAYASPGALYGVQIYVRITGLPELSDAVYYLNSRSATLHRVHDVISSDPTPRISVSLIGQRSVITTVYKTNVDEVLHLEGGHILGLLDTVAPATSHILGAKTHADVDPRLIEGKAGDRFIIGTWPLTVGKTSLVDPLDDVTYRIEVFGGDLKGVYQPQPQDLVRTGTTPIIRRKDVIAINQRVYDQASFGLALSSNGSPESYIQLGRALQRVEHNELGFGLMSSGYSSHSGNPLATARRIQAFTGNRLESSYFALGGPITSAQIAHTGMNEDMPHIQGPAEIITTDVSMMLPRYMLPDTIRIVDALPKTPNGKIDLETLREIERKRIDLESDTPRTAPASVLEKQLVEAWTNVLGASEPLSTTESFFTLGGNSITAVKLTRVLQSTHGLTLPVQSIFEYDTIVKQAEAIDAGRPEGLSRVVPLAGTGPAPVFMWPGLGGYPMNLRPLAEKIAGHRFRCYGVQTYGLNVGEELDPDITSMARRDIEAIRRIKPSGPYNLIGYSFGARVAFEVAHQLEAAGEVVTRLILLAPGSPILAERSPIPDARGSYRDDRFTRVLYSVFAGRTDGEAADRVVAASIDRPTFLAAIAPETALDADLIERITRLVEKTHSFRYRFDELIDRDLRTAVTVIRAIGDDYSFLDQHADHTRITTVTVPADHYQILKSEHIETTAESVLYGFTRPMILTHPKENRRMPHVAIKHFPATFTESELQEFIEGLSALVCNAFHVEDSAVSVSLESVRQESWDTDVYQPEIVERKQFLVKAPQY